MASNVDTQLDNYSWYIISVLCFIALILSIFPCTHTLFHLWFKNTENISLVTKVIVTFGLILLFLHVCDHTFFRLCQWVPNGFGITLSFCIAHIWFVSITYYIGKALMYTYFVLRANTIFKFTAFAYKPLTVYCSLISINMLSIFLTITWPILDTPFLQLSTIESTKGRQCKISSGDYKLTQSSFSAQIVAYELALATTLDIIFSIITVWMLVGKLFYISNNSLNSNINSVDLLQMNDKDIDIHVRRFHQITKPQNKVLILSTKLLVLELITILCAQITLILFLWISGESYEFDGCINIYCLWLTFRFTEKYYKKMFCGSCCIRTYFPCLKMIAVGCDHTDRKINCKNIISVCCCCCIDSSYKQYYVLAKREYQLFLGFKNGKIRTGTVNDAYNHLEMETIHNQLDEPLL